MSLVGANIISIITESLYDRPIVVFREYIQNSADSILRSKDKKRIQCQAMIWRKGKDLFFLDNGKGIDYDKFETKMLDIGYSEKRREKDIGYKGIGRLSGLSYCMCLEFYNICDYDKEKVQKHTFSNEKFLEIKRSKSYIGMTAEQALAEISVTCDDVMAFADVASSITDLQKQTEMLKTSNTGFMVVLRDISTILDNTIKEKIFEEQLGWLLPVEFKEELITLDDVGSLFEEFNTNPDLCTIPVLYEDKPIKRPIAKNSLRGFTWYRKYDNYAIGFHTLNNSHISIDKNNSFQGIKVYLKNVLLCDETELIPALQLFGTVKHTTNELIQTVRGIGAMIYITDTSSIAANARRTFVEVTNKETTDFLYLLADFVEQVYLARYALSRYQSASRIFAGNVEKIERAKKEALESLKALAEQQVVVPEIEPPKAFDDMPIGEQQRLVRNMITTKVNKRITDYFQHTHVYNLETAFVDFFAWLKTQENID